ncbi:ankyrin repeat domain-containing protein [bacterium]|nr:ankyrin repeat domain-containing protein [bacterium]
MWVLFLFWLNLIKDGNLDELKKQPIKNWNIYDENKMTPLMYAAHYNEIDILNYLLENGADPCLKNRRGLDSFLISLESKKKDVSKILLNRCKKKNPLWVYYALTYDNYDIAEQLIDSDAPLTWNEDGVDILSLAILKNRVTTVQKLLKKGFSIKKIPKNGRNPLSVALQNGNLEIIEYLLKNSMNPNLKDTTGETQLNYSIMFKGDIRVVELLLSFNADPLQKGLSGEIPILKAVQLGKLDIVKLLLKYGGEDINNDAGMNALYYSVFNKKIFMFFIDKLGDKILEKGSNSNESFSFHIARYLEISIIKTLPKKWFKFEDKGLLGENYLTLAVSSGDLEKVDYFYNLFPELLNKKDFFGKPPLIYTINSNNTDILRYLLEKGAIDNITFENKTALQFAKTYNLDRFIYILSEYNK